MGQMNVANAVVQQTSVVENATDVLRFLTAGSVDDGKSSLIGRLLFDTHAIADDQLAALGVASRKRGLSETDLSLLTDGLEAERAQGITIDVAYRYFKTPQRTFIIADTPGHAQYTRNMVTGASTADAAVILVDARKGLLEQTKRHVLIAHLLGIKHIIVAMNKMDLVGYEYSVFHDLRNAFLAFTAPLNIAHMQFIPVSALRGDMVVTRGDRIDWYDGPTLLETLHAIELTHSLHQRPLRFPVQWVCRDAQSRTYTGRLISGVMAQGQTLTVLPSGRSSVVTQLRVGLHEVERAVAGDAISVSLADQLDITRGDMLVAPAHKPTEQSSLRATLCWLDESPLNLNTRYLLKHTTRYVTASITQVLGQLDVHTGQMHESTTLVAMNDLVVAELLLAQPIFSDAYSDSRTTGSFVLIDPVTLLTVAAGMIE
jgi:sulfate adenylyltransferase subunit 1